MYPNSDINIFNSMFNVNPNTTKIKGDGLNEQNYWRFQSKLFWEEFWKYSKCFRKKMKQQKC